MILGILKPFFLNERLSKGILFFENWVRTHFKVFHSRPHLAHLIKPLNKSKNWIPKLGKAHFKVFLSGPHLAHLIKPFNKSKIWIPKIKDTKKNPQLGKMVWNQLELQGEQLMNELSQPCHNFSSKTWN